MSQPELLRHVSVHSREKWESSAIANRQSVASELPPRIESFTACIGIAFCCIEMTRWADVRNYCDSGGCDCQQKIICHAENGGVLFRAASGASFCVMRG
jgi:hypothetical protein